jgi:hypothetical protein
MNFRTRQGIPTTRADRIRRFDRFYVRRIEAEHRAARVQELTVAEMRVLEVLGETGHSRTAVWLQWRTELDAGYLCRILRKFCDHGYHHGPPLRPRPPQPRFRPDPMGPQHRPGTGSIPS